MRTSGVLQHASMASSCDWEWDILDMRASRIIALQLALDLQTHLIDPSPAEQTAALDVTLFPHPSPLALARTQTDSLMGHQTKLPVWLASTKVMNDKYHSPTALFSLQLRAAQSGRMKCVVFSAVWFRHECIVSLGVQLILTLSGLESVYWHCLFYVLCRSN